MLHVGRDILSRNLLTLPIRYLAESLSARIKTTNLITLIKWKWPLTKYFQYQHYNVGCYPFSSIQYFVRLLSNPRDSSLCQNFLILVFMLKGIIVWRNLTSQKDGRTKVTQYTPTFSKRGITTTCTEITLNIVKLHRADPWVVTSSPAT